MGVTSILLVEDSEAIVMGLQYLIESEGYQCLVARDCREALDVFHNQKVDLVILDIGLPDGDGFKLCEEMRRKQDISVLFLTAREEEEDVVKAFSLGAEDYVMKPFRNKELMVRVKSILRRNGKASEILQCQNIKLDTVMGKTFIDGEEVSLTRLEYKIMYSMMSHPGKLFTREEILEGVWDLDGNFVNDNTLTVTMKRLREKIKDKDAKIIKTVRGMGYRIEKES